MNGFTSEQVAHYYDLNTASFLRYGRGGQFSALHRAVWAPGVRRRDAAFHYVDRLILSELDRVRRNAAPTVVDLGCGCGSSLGFLLARRPLRAVGITNSRVQRELAAEQLARYGRRVDVRCGDFCTMPLGEGVDLCFAIESFVQAPDARRFLAAVGGALRPGGRLVLCDDFLGTATEDRGRARRLDEARRGWHMSSLLAPRDVDALAGDHGLEPVEDRDLTPWLELHRPRDVLLELVVRVVRALPFSSRLRNPRWSSWLGGAGLRACLASRVIEYRYRVWRRR